MRLIDLSENADDARGEIIAGLSAPTPFIAPKYFYDGLGARLFEAICELPEYTLTRDEAAIFRSYAAEIAERIGPGCTLIDLGAGDCRKAERLFAQLKPAQYVAVDIGGEFLAGSLSGLAQRHAGLDIVGVVQDFTRGLRLPPEVRNVHRVFFYPGSSIGNFTPTEAAAFLERLHALSNGGQLLLGADLVKSARELESAYDDALGVTAAFNLNVLNNVNRTAGTDFDVNAWRHIALFDAGHSRIEMYLEARRDVLVSWSGGQRRLSTGERIHTEISCKYTNSVLAEMLAAAGFRRTRIYTGEPARFALVLAQAGT